jgi:mono/diheme cytochrome c family protein
VGCHGEQGDGDGPAARFLDPKPRDFRLGKIKFSSVASGDPPRDEDYLRVIEHGLRGTAMPSFALLGQRERAALVVYIREFVEPGKRKPGGAALAIPADPWTRDPAGAIAAGKTIYHTQAKCWSCHPAYVSRAEISALYREAGLGEAELRPSPSESVPTESSWGGPIRAPDFLVDRVKTGIEPTSLVQVIQAGVGGTAMPTWAGALRPKELWALSYYVRSLALMRGQPEGTALRKTIDLDKEAPK